MDTKLKRISYHWITKTVAFVLICVLFGSLVSMSIDFFYFTESADFRAKDYANSREAQRIILNTYYDANSLLDYKDKEGASPNDSEGSATTWRGYANEEVQISIQVVDEPAYNAAKKRLDNLEGLYYYITDGDLSFTNCQMETAEEFEQMEYHIIITSAGAIVNSLGQTRYFLSADPGREIYMAFNDDFMALKQKEFASHKREWQNRLVMIFSVFLLGLALLVYSLGVSGRDETGQLRLTLVDGLRTDISTALLVLTVISYGVFLTVFLSKFWDNTIAIIGMNASVAAIFCGVGLMLLLSLARHIKNKTIWRHSLINKACGVLIASAPVNAKIVIIVLLAEFITMILSMAFRHSVAMYFALMLFCTAGIIYFITQYVLKPYDDEVRERVQSSLAKEMKAEKLKTELITNVSHDLKTPLTSIINYAGLLVKEDDGNEYARAIYEQSQKLKNLTEDLFEVSKAQSGNISVHLENLSIPELIGQTLAEFDHPDLDFKTNIPSLTIRADGKLMSRVFENLLGNIVKYSLPNTRVYIDACQQKQKTYITFKNIANYEMNFDSGEILERFARGDASRTTEGNGLGLAIAQSYTEACGGRLEISVDGDLFKVTLTF